MNFLKKEKLFLVIAILLFIIPFFWLKLGEMDLGGDSSRLYFYNPLAFLKSVAIYSVVPWGTGVIDNNQYLLPYLLLLVFLKFIFHSSTVLIAIFNGLKLSGSFVFAYLTIREFILIRDFHRQEFNNEMARGRLAIIMGGLFYTFSPAVLDNMKYALVTHDQVFVYPMVFYFLLLALTKSSLKYVWLALLTTVIFSSSFVIFNPPLFAFFPLAIIFLFTYNFFVLRKPFPWKGFFVSALLFLGLHSFHLIPVAINIFDKGSEFNTRVFESASNVNVGLEYFNAILPRGIVSRNILLPLENSIISWNLLLTPLLVILGLLSVKKKNKTLLLVGIFFFITLFLISANITQVGVELYKKLFLIPGFGMFRNFSGQWQWVYTFFYALLVGLAIFNLFVRIKGKYAYFLFFVVLGSLIVRSWIVFNGDIVNVVNRGTKDTPIVIKVDPDYEKLLAYINDIPDDGKILQIPFTDFGYNLFGGSNDGVYVGKSMLSLILGRNDFSGYQDIDPFSEVFVKLSRAKDYPLIRHMMSLLQIRYVLYNSDIRISDKFFPTFPYGYTGVPASPSAALGFVQNISQKMIFGIGHYSLFEVNREQYLPNFFIASELLPYDINPKYDTQYFKASSFLSMNQQVSNRDSRVVYLDRQSCGKIFPKNICDKNSYELDNGNAQVIFQKINPTKYRVEIKNATKPFLLVLQDSFTPKWKLYKSEKDINIKNISDSYYGGSILEANRISDYVDKNPFQTSDLESVYENTHIEVNGYANAWYIDIGKLQVKDYNLIVEMDGQKIFYYSFFISAITFMIFLISGAVLFFKRNE